MDNPSKKTHKWPNRHMKRSLSFLIIREMQAKTTMSYTTSHQSEWSSLKSLQITNAGEGMEKGNPLACWWKCKLVIHHEKQEGYSSKKLKVELPHDPAIPLLGIYIDKTVMQKDKCTPVLTAPLFTIART